MAGPRKRRRVHLVVPLLLAVIGAALAAVAENPFHLSPEFLAGIEKQYGADARRRLIAWQELITNDTAPSDAEKLEKVNAFFNQVRFIGDRRHWHKSDYWATPVEFLATNGGDCEDFALAKYFTLKAIGIEESKLNLTYVKALRLNQAHMVVTYYATPQAEPLVLDNLNTEIKPASQRRDLLPVYSFNGSGLWLAKMRGRGEMVGGSDRLQRWQELLQRMPEGLRGEQKDNDGTEKMERGEARAEEREGTENTSNEERNEQ